MLFRIETMRPWAGERLPDEEGILYPGNIEELWTVEALNEVGLAPVQPFAPPDGFHAVGNARYLLEGGVIKTDFDVEADSTPVPETLSRWQFFTIAAKQNIISQSDALAAVRTGTLPQPFVDFIATLPTDDDRFEAEMLLSSVQEFHRRHRFVEAFLSAQNMTEAQADAIWIAGAALGST